MMIMILTLGDSSNGELTPAYVERLQYDYRMHY